MTSDDVWGQVSLASTKRAPNSTQVAKDKVVRDDWDDDDDDDEPERDVGGKGNEKTSYARSDGAVPGSNEGAMQKREESTKIWEEANKRAPMPELIVAPASTSQCSLPPPSAALQPTLRILKRPSPNPGGHSTGAQSPAPFSSSLSAGSGSGSGGTSPAPRGTLAEREAQYQEARSRIFGEKPGIASGNASSVSMPMSRTSSSSGGVVVVRDPFGPASDTDIATEDKACGLGRPTNGFGEK